MAPGRAGGVLAGRPQAQSAGADHSGSATQLALWRDQIAAAAVYAHVPWYVLWGVFGRETNFGRFVGTSSSGAMGLMQFEPATAAEYNYPMTNYPNRHESQQQFTAAALLLRNLHREYHGWAEAIDHYSNYNYTLADVQAKAGTTQTQPPSRLLPPPVQVYFNPLKYADVTPGRVDQGVDYTDIRGGWLTAIADGIVGISYTNLPGWYGGYVVYEITQDGPLKGRYIYYAEGVNTVVVQYEPVKGGQKIANLRSGWALGIEMGYANDMTTGHSWALEHGGWPPDADRHHYSTRAGIAFNDLLIKLGASGGVVSQTQIGELPPWHVPSLLAVGQQSGPSQSPTPPNILSLSSANPIVAQDDYSKLITDTWSGLDAAFHRAWVRALSTHQQVNGITAITTR